MILNLANRKTFRIITNATYFYNLPCIGEDGKMYSIHQVKDNIPTYDIYGNPIVYYDRVQKLYLVPVYHQEVKNGKKIVVQDAIENFNKSIFNRVKTTDEYVNMRDTMLELFESDDKINEIKALFDTETDPTANAFESAYYLLERRPEDLVESRTSYEDLLDYLKELYSFTDRIKGIVEK